MLRKTLGKNKIQRVILIKNEKKKMRKMKKMNKNDELVLDVAKYLEKISRKADNESFFARIFLKSSVLFAFFSILFSIANLGNLAIIFLIFFFVFMGSFSE